jgi:hypothetical protein
MLSCYDVFWSVSITVLCIVLGSICLYYGLLLSGLHINMSNLRGMGMVHYAIFSVLC